MIVFGAFFCAAFLAVLLKEKIEMLVAPTMIIIVMVSYFFMQIGILKAGLYLDCFVCTVATIAVIITCFKDYQRVNEYVITCGAGTFILSIFFFYIFSIGIDLSKSVDAYFWASSVKLLYFTDNIKEVWTRIPNTHPIFAGVWGYLVEKTWIRWDDAALVASKNIMIFASLLPIYTVFEGKLSYCQRVYNCVFTTIMIIVFPYISCSANMNEYANYGVDVLLGIMIGMGAALFGVACKQEKNRYYITSLCYFVAALQLKRIAIVLVSLQFIWVFMMLFIKKQVKMSIIFLVVSTLSYYISMGMSLYLFGVIGAYMGGLILATIYFRKVKVQLILLVILLGIGAGTIAVSGWVRRDEYANNMIRAFFVQIASNENYYIDGFFKLSMVAFVLLSVTASVIILKYIKTVTDEDRCVLVGVLTATVVYIFILGYLYVTTIGPANSKFGYVLAGFDRYMGTITVMILCPLFFVVLTHMADMVSIVMCFTLLLADVQGFTKYVLIRTEKQFYPGISDEVHKNVDAIYVYIDMERDGDNVSFEIEALPSRTVYINELSKNVIDQQGYPSADDIEMKYTDADYVYLNRLDDDFREKYSSLFINGEDIHENGLYEVLNDGTLSLIK